MSASSIEKRKLSLAELTADFIQEACELAINEGDYCIIEDGRYKPMCATGAGHVSYSRYFAGGGYESAFNYNCARGDQLTITPIITGIPEGWKYGEKLTFDMRDPMALQKVAEAIRSILATKQLDRSSELVTKGDPNYKWYDGGRPAVTLRVRPPGPWWKR